MYRAGSSVCRPESSVLAARGVAAVPGTNPRSASSASAGATGPPSASRSGAPLGAPTPPARRRSSSRPRVPAGRPSRGRTPRRTGCVTRASVPVYSSRNREIYARGVAGDLDRVVAAVAPATGSTHERQEDEWVGADSNCRPAPCEGAVITGLDHQPDTRQYPRPGLKSCFVGSGPR